MTTTTGSMHRGDCERDLHASECPCQSELICRCGANVTAPVSGTVTTCPACGGQWMTDKYAREGDTGYVHISPEHAASIRDPKWTAARQPRIDPIVTTTYRARVELFYPVTDESDRMYGGSHTEWAECPHKHPTYEAAEKCGEKLRRSAVRNRNRSL
jgi:hypothetical protein